VVYFGCLGNTASRGKRGGVRIPSLPAKRQIEWNTNLESLFWLVVAAGVFAWMWRARAT